MSLASTHLQTNWTRRSRESSGSFVSFLAEETLLASGTGLTISTLKRWQSKDTSVTNTKYRISLICMQHILKKLTAGPGAPTGPWGPVGPGGPWEKGNEIFTSSSQTPAQNGNAINNLHALLYHLCFPSALALRFLPAGRKRSNSFNYSRGEREIKMWWQIPAENEHLTAQLHPTR